ncbi:MAG: IS630 family transposase, partial [Methylotenera sp.]
SWIRHMLFVTPLSCEENTTLNEIHKNHWNHAPRVRSHAILLSAQGFKLSKISEILSVCRQTVATWVHAWENDGICGLIDLPRSGRPCILCDESEVKAIEYVEQSPRSLKTVLAELSDKLDIDISHATLKRACKRAGLSWKRVRKSLKSKRDPVLFEKSRQQLEALIEQDKQGIIDLYYFDESGFTLDPCVPYAWQPIGKTIEIPASKSDRLNVLGFIKRDCSFFSIVFNGSVTSSVVVASIDSFILTIQRPTSLVIDNASVHTSSEFMENIERWKEHGLTIVPISPYSPELNIIEILWRKIKYEWMPFSAYQSFANLNDSLVKILANIGISYTINFA